MNDYFGIKEWMNEQVHMNDLIYSTDIECQLYIAQCWSQMIKMGCKWYVLCPHGACILVEEEDYLLSYMTRSPEVGQHQGWWIQGLHDVIIDPSSVFTWLSSECGLLSSTRFRHGHNMAAAARLHTTASKAGGNTSTSPILCFNYLFQCTFPGPIK